MKRGTISREMILGLIIAIVFLIAMIILLGGPILDMIHRGTDYLTSILTGI